ncbi:ubiquinol-cytochrome C reductase [Dissoconium aciculare CBS 342.82]|uniref:Complex III subunit 9 n=1 Tax=Dissoconium aciculare CBS 342.82 TaxID=1314786 RepID=A0A6J3LY80_9PEZI|nr:ubiquinol-cytochrome C reductase [Dissoconium aciculare CBS 342.82]KAF1820725.1 ubiquinol-cytochrome C reductase [Dissoconium aciculare CBS 342.82]
MAGILSGIYSTFIRRNAVFLGTIFVGAFATEIAFDTGANYIWDQANKGRQWKDIKQRYLEASEDDE